MVEIGINPPRHLFLDVREIDDHPAMIELLSFQRVAQLARIERRRGGVRIGRRRGGNHRQVRLMGFGGG